MQSNRAVVVLKVLVLYFDMQTCVKLDLFAAVPFPAPPANSYTDTDIQKHTHTHTDFASVLRLPSDAQRGTVKLSSLPCLCSSALSCRISLLTKSCHGLQGLKMAMERSKKWNSKNKSLIYFCTCMLMSACIYIYMCMSLGVRALSYVWEFVQLCL